VIALQTADLSSRQRGRPTETRLQLQPSDTKYHLATSPRVARYQDILTVTCKVTVKTVNSTEKTQMENIQRVTT
jgi:hypothetical protein